MPLGLAANDLTDSFECNGAQLRHLDLRKVFGTHLERFPWVLRLLAENALRNAKPEERAGIRDAFIAWLTQARSTAELEIFPVRLMMHDTTCIPALVDLAALRDAVAGQGGDPEKLNPVLPIDVSVDHSLSVQFFGQPEAAALNLDREYRLNSERYRMMKWASVSLGNIRVHPPGTGIMHTINLEQLAEVVTIGKGGDGSDWAIPDLMLGTDSHTPMVNGIGVLAWGVGGLEAEAVMFGLPVTLKLPEVVGVRLSGRLPDGVMATDLALLVTEQLRKLGVSGEYVEFFGPGVGSLSGNDRAVIANMAPEYGASSGFFPIDGRSLEYLRDTGRAFGHVEMVERAAEAIGIAFDPQATPAYSKCLEIDLTQVRTCLAGPTRPQDRIATGAVARSLESAAGRGLRPAPDNGPPDGAVAIAAITSCTNTSSPRLLIAAGLLARAANRRGMKPPNWVKTSLAPGSPSAKNLLRRAGLMDNLEAIGFSIVGYGCTTCIGNSGPLTATVANALADGGLAVAVLSGNRNFPGRVHPDLPYSFLASPPLVVAYALAGDINRDILADPVGCDRSGRSVFLPELWPTNAEVERCLAQAAQVSGYRDDFAVAAQSEKWEALDASVSPRFPWDSHSTYLRPPPFAVEKGNKLGRYAAYPLLVLGDDITTDHISPAGQITVPSEAADYLLAAGESPDTLNVFASRRGNWEVMLRGVFTNRGVRNHLADDLPGGWTIHVPTGRSLPVGEAAALYAAAGDAVVVVAGERYGAGSSRDWAAKGIALLGVRAVLARSFERIHRTNLIGMGILPVLVPADFGPALRAGDRVIVEAPEEAVRPRAEVFVVATSAGRLPHRMKCRLDVQTEREAHILRCGGILPMLRESCLEDGVATIRPFK